MTLMSAWTVLCAPTFCRWPAAHHRAPSRGKLNLVSDDDWRLTNQGTYLSRARLRCSTWHRPREDWDHNHCEFCWAEFSDYPSMPHLRIGLVTTDGRHWICPPCYRDFAARFVWVVENEAP